MPTLCMSNLCNLYRTSIVSRIQAPRPYRGLFHRELNRVDPRRGRRPYVRPQTPGIIPHMMQTVHANILVVGLESNLQGLDGTRPTPDDSHHFVPYLSVNHPFLD